MFQIHVTRRLAALIDGQLPAADEARVNRHVSSCMQCAAALESVRFSADLLSSVPRVEAPASIWNAIEAGLALSEHPRAEGARLRVEGARLRVEGLALAAVVLVSLAGIVAWQVTRQRERSDVVRLDARGGEAWMALGEWIETGGESQARVRLGEIGTVDVGPNTRIQLVAARPEEHRLNLAHGSIRAEIQAPPRLFFVNTSSSTVVDLGCAYTMTVDQAGVGLLRVTSGWASLEWDGRESIVPAGASCPTRPEVGPGTPSFEEASDSLRQALTAFDFDGGGARALDVILSEARARDTLTLWHLLSRVDAGDRSRVFDRLVDLSPLPAGVVRDKALALDPATLKLWREELAWTW